MSEEIKATVTEEEEAMKALGEFANSCYNEGVKNALIGVGIGAILLALITFGTETVDLWKAKTKLKKDIEEFVQFTYF